jgi:putative addiction module killer protein
MLPLRKVDVLEYLDRSGRSPFAMWFESLSASAAAKVAVAVTGLSQGNFSNVKGVGGGVYEYRVNFGPGFRIYLGKDGECVIILLAGGSKKRQQKDIEDAQTRWQDYKKRKLHE